MGKGKGNPEAVGGPVKPGRMLYEMEGVDETIARQAFRLAAHKLPSHPLRRARGLPHEARRTRDLPSTSSCTKAIGRLRDEFFNVSLREARHRPARGHRQALGDFARRGTRSKTVLPRSARQRSERKRACGERSSERSSATRWTRPSSCGSSGLVKDRQYKKYVRSLLALHGPRRSQRLQHGRQVKIIEHRLSARKRWKVQETWFGRRFCLARTS